jgi:hypothetical protein
MKHLMPVFKNKEAAEKARDWYVTNEWKVTDIREFSNGGWGFDAWK